MDSQEGDKLALKGIEAKGKDVGVELEAPRGEVKKAKEVQKNKCNRAPTTIWISKAVTW